MEAVVLINFQSHEDDRGILTAYESNKNVPFEIQRNFNRKA